MSFTSVLPTPQIILKAKPAPPTDTAKGIDTLVSLTVYAAPKDAAKGTEALSAFSVSIPPQLDTAKAADLPALAGPSPYGYLLRIVQGTDLARGIRGDIILPDDQNNLVHVWRAKLDKLSDVRLLLEAAYPDKVSTFDAYYSVLQSIVSAMPIVGYGDPVYAEHFNLHLQALRALIELEEWIASSVCTSASDLLAAINDVKYYADQLSEKGSGDVVSSRDWNALKLAVGFVQKMDDAANACLLQPLEPEFPRLRLYDSTSKITVYCTKNPRTHYGKESGMPANYVYTYWFEESYDWDYDDAMVRIYWEPPYWRLEIYKGNALDVHNWYYDNTLIVGNLTDTYPHGVYKLHAVIWLDAVTKDLVKYEVY